MTNRDFHIYRHAIVHPVLIFHRTTNCYMLISVTPVIRQTFHQTVYPLSNKKEIDIPTNIHHFPGIFTPPVCILHKKIGTKAGKNRIPRRYFIFTILFTAQRQIIIIGFSNYRAVLSVFSVYPVNVAMPAAFTQLMATVPWVPQRRRFFHIYPKIKK